LSPVELPNRECIRREANIDAARYRPAGTREALPGAMPFRFSVERRGLAPDFFVATASASMN
jgi:hypothetical protein